VWRRSIRTAKRVTANVLGAKDKRLIQFVKYADSDHLQLPVAQSSLKKKEEFHRRLLFPHPELTKRRIRITCLQISRLNHRVKCGLLPFNKNSSEKGHPFLRKSPLTTQR
jgi:hypothetical protein